MQPPTALEAWTSAFAILLPKLKALPDDALDSLSTTFRGADVATMKTFFAWATAQRIFTDGAPQESILKLLNVLNASFPRRDEVVSLRASFIEAFPEFRPRVPMVPVEDARQPQPQPPRHQVMPQNGCWIWVSAVVVLVLISTLLWTSQAFPPVAPGPPSFLPAASLPPSPNPLSSPLSSLPTSLSPSPDPPPPSPSPSPDLPPHPSHNPLSSSPDGSPPSPNQLPTTPYGPHIQLSIKGKLLDLTVDGSAILDNSTLNCKVSFILRKELWRSWSGPACAHLYVMAYNQNEDVVYTSPCIGTCVGFYSENEAPLQSQTLEMSWDVGSATIVRLDEELLKGDCPFLPLVTVPIPSPLPLSSTLESSPPSSPTPVGLWILVGFAGIPVVVILALYAYLRDFLAWQIKKQD